MADEKKRDDDYTIELGDSSDRRPNEPRFVQAEPRPLAAPAPSLSFTNNPMISIVCYCGSSILMTVANKYLVSAGNFNLTFFLLFVQALVCILAISISKGLNLIHYRDFHPSEARKWFPIALLLIGMIYTSMKALQYLTIPVYTIFKNLTIILIAYGEVLWFGGSVTGMALFSFGLMVLSSVIAAWADIRHALMMFAGDSVTGEAAEKISSLNAGYFWMLLNCFSSAMFVLGMRKRIKMTNFKDFDTMFYNNLLSLPILLLSSLFLEDWSPANLSANFPPGQRTSMITAMIFTGLSSIFISYASAWCVRVTSSTTYSMVGALNKLPIAISGLVFFDAPVTLPGVGAIGVGFVSGVVYAVAKVWQKEEQAKGGSGDGGRAGASLLPTTVSASVKSMRDSLKS